VNIIQFVHPNGTRRVGVIDGADVIDITAGASQWDCTLKLAQAAIREGCSLVDKLRLLVGGGERRDYAELWNSHRDADRGYLLPPVSGESLHRTLITGTGLTHTGSMESRDKMHKEEVDQPAQELPLTDSAKMFQMGIEGGKPAGESRGVAPEWFYKGNGVNLRAHRDQLELPAFGRDGGEEPELVGCYFVDEEGAPRRLGFAIGNEWSDHATEKINYLYLAPSKIRTCAVGPELVVGHDFQDLDVRCTVQRGGETIYDSGDLKSGQQFMCHSLANCEDHHFKYPLHRQAGDVHLHFFGTSQLSYSQRDWKYQSGDEITVAVSDFSRPLINTVVDGSHETARPVRVAAV